jgi:hypothetical protein
VSDVSDGYKGNINKGKKPLKDIEDETTLLTECPKT